jgi:hypothetical protein
MASAKTKPKKEPFVIRSLTLSQDTGEVLERVSQDASDYTGRKVSGSAVVRALLRYAERQGYEWGITNLCPLIEAEFSSGVVWGKKKE